MKENVDILPHTENKRNTLGVKRLTEEATIPVYAKYGDSGFDLRASEDVIIEPGETALIPTGLAFDIPEGQEIQIRPRSGITSKTKLRVNFGTVDSGYQGEVKVSVDNIMPVESTDGFIDNSYHEVITLDGNVEVVDGMYPFGSYVIRKGDRIAQAVVAPVTTVEFAEIGDFTEKSERGEGGFGHSGTN